MTIDFDLKLIDKNKLYMIVHPEDAEHRERELVCSVNPCDNRHLEVLKMAQAAPDLLQSLEDMLTVYGRQSEVAQLAQKRVDKVRGY